MRDVVDFHRDQATIDERHQLQLVTRQSHRVVCEPLRENRSKDAIVPTRRV